MYEDDATLAFLDLRQPNPGHVLVVPKVHVPMLDQLPLDVAARLIQTVVLVTGAVRRGFAPDGINVWQSNGVAAGQEVFHVHLHVFPRRAGDDCLRIYPEAPPTPHGRNWTAWRHGSARQSPSDRQGRSTVPLSGEGGRSRPYPPSRRLGVRRPGTSGRKGPRRGRRGRTRR